MVGIHQIRHATNILDIINHFMIKHLVSTTGCSIKIIFNIDLSKIGNFYSKKSYSNVISSKL